MCCLFPTLPFSLMLHFPLCSHCTISVFIPFLSSCNPSPVHHNYKWCHHCGSTESLFSLWGVVWVGKKCSQYTVLFVKTNWLCPVHVHHNYRWCHCFLFNWVTIFTLGPIRVTSQSILMKLSHSWYGSYTHLIWELHTSDMGATRIWSRYNSKCKSWWRKGWFIYTSLACSG